MIKHHPFCVVAVTSAVLTLSSMSSAQTPAWPQVILASPRDVTLGSSVGQALTRGVARLSQEPYTKDWLLSDVSFKVDRIFTNYSGDVSGRFIELATLTSPQGAKSPATLAPVLAEIVGYQKADGHFGRDMDITKPVQKLSPPIPMLWGNARLLVGLVTAAREYNDPELLEAARRLGDYYVESASQFCSPAREAEFLATGTSGEGFPCCYFPAIESLALLYRATQDVRYLEQAKRMAEVFRKYDALPCDHSHGNLCTWRGILELYDLTNDRGYLDRTRAKWDAAVNGSFVWPIGGVGEHWHVSYGGDEGCSESDWLRLNLELWRFTGDTRYLDMGERLLHNQYAANQCPNGGYGMCHLDGDPAGPVAKHPGAEEWNFCCSFHGPLGLHFLKRYLAAGSERGVFVNFPLDFASHVFASGQDWHVAVRRKGEKPLDELRVEIELSPGGDTKSARTTLWLRVPAWAGEVRICDASGAAVSSHREGGYLCVDRDFKSGEPLVVNLPCTPKVEARRFKPFSLSPAQMSKLEDVSVVLGPNVLFAAAGGTGRLNLLATVDTSGQLAFPGRTAQGLVTVALPASELSEPSVASAAAELESARPVILRPWSEHPQRKRAAFAHNLIVVPAGAIDSEALARFTRRVQELEKAGEPAFFGERLEKQPEAWLAGGEWKFQPEGLLVAGGDVGLLDGEGYKDYRFEFDLLLPKEGEGMAGWVVRASDPGNGLMFQVQSGDSTFEAAQFKTKPNTLRPHVRRNSEWTIADPVPLPKEIRRGETHHFAVECRGECIEVFLDGQKIHSQSDAGFHQGTVGFRAAGPAEQGLFSKIAMQRLTPG